MMRTRTSLGIPLLGAQEIATVREKHFFDAGVEYNGTHRTLLASPVPAPAAVPTCDAKETGQKSSTETKKLRLLELDTHESAMKMCTRCSASFSYSLFASSTSFLRMLLFRAMTL